MLEATHPVELASFLILRLSERTIHPLCARLLDFLTQLKSAPGFESSKRFANEDTAGVAAALALGAEAGIVRDASTGAQQPYSELGQQCVSTLPDSPKPR